LSALLVGGLFAVIILLARRLDPNRRLVLLLTALAGPVWLIGMRNLSAFHDYTAMYYLGIPLAFYAALITRLRWPGGVWLALVFVGFGLSLIATTRSRICTSETGSRSTATSRFQLWIADALPGGRASTSRTGFHSRRTPWVPTFPTTSLLRRPSPIT
jgi:hypothetical protein